MLEKKLEKLLKKKHFAMMAHKFLFLLHRRIEQNSKVKIRRRQKMSVLSVLPRFFGKKEKKTIYLKSFGRNI